MVNGGARRWSGTPCYLNLSVAEAARTVSELVERAGLSSRMVDCHELRQGENLCGMVLLFEK